MPYNSIAPVEARVERVIVQRRTIIVVPTPAPTPTPPPPSRSSPPPVQSSNPPPLLVHPPATTHNSDDSSSQARYTPAPGGREIGEPQGTGTAAPAATTAPLATAAPIPTPTPRSCSQPHQDAATTQKAEADYPELARQQGAVGSVTVKVNLSANGSVADLGVYKSSGNSALDREALKAARNSRYSPEVEACEKVAGQYLFVVDFTSQ